VAAVAVASAIAGADAAATAGCWLDPRGPCRMVAADP
jgi:hypothetical protein